MAPEVTMFIRKSRITHLIRREKLRERRKCERESLEKIKEIGEQHEFEKSRMERQLKAEFKNAVHERDQEIRELKRELARNYQLYQDLRRRELYLNELSAEFENVIDLMGVRIQETMQPFFRARAKVEAIKRRSDRRHDKVDSRLTAVK